MKLITGNARVKAWVNKRPEWTRWFAWFPVEVERDTYLWLQWIERKRRYQYVIAGQYRRGYYYNLRVKS